MFTAKGLDKHKNDFSDDYMQTDKFQITRPMTTNTVTFMSGSDS